MYKLTVKGVLLEILYSAIEQKQAELEESLTTIHQRQEQIRQDFDCQDNPEKFTQNDSACMQLAELAEQERAVHEEFNILSMISKTDGDFEDIRLAARDAHTCIIDESEFGTTLNTEEAKLNNLADHSDNKYQDLILEYKRLKKMPPDDLSQEELLKLFMSAERKIAKEKIRRDLFTLMAERMLHEFHLKSREDDLYSREPDGLSL